MRQFSHLWPINWMTIEESHDLSFILTGDASLIIDGTFSFLGDNAGGKQSITDAENPGESDVKTEDFVI
ncbi:hypothetical protein GDO81_021487 [Engystomops pustulosus]|uniref:Uncharacterized protein n=1 Tax=Engystomops pustulosus TaxID=76066 RepID=A0AAV6ZET2_ENGPU|nr:hypothetical protein GDO81_021487 [Engystomops pustulosus]